MGLTLHPCWQVVHVCVGYVLHPLRICIALAIIVLHSILPLLSTCPYSSSFCLPCRGHGVLANP